MKKMCNAASAQYGGVSGFKRRWCVCVCVCEIKKDGERNGGEKVREKIKNIKHIRASPYGASIYTVWNEVKWTLKISGAQNRERKGGGEGGDVGMGWQFQLVFSSFNALPLGQVQYSSKEKK